jgi:hypothetical protein
MNMNVDNMQLDNVRMFFGTRGDMVVLRVDTEDGLPAVEMQLTPEHAEQMAATLQTFAKTVRDGAPQQLLGTQ